MKKAEKAIKITRDLIKERGFKERHRKSKQNFIRERLLTLPVLIMLLLKKSAKSAQLLLNETLEKLGVKLVSSSAFSQARKKLKHTAFIELNQEAVVKVCYEDGDYKTYKGHRMLGIDGSKIYLPNTKAICERFGGNPKNQQSEEITPYGLASVMFDVLNKIAVDSILGEAKAYEVDLAKKHLEKTQKGDVLLFDRNYPSYMWLATLKKQEIDYVGRCSTVSFKPVREMFANKGPNSQIVTLKCPSKHREAAKALKLPLEIEVRLVRVPLNTGEMEVLITTLTDEEVYPTEDFGGIYFMRWGSETFYDLIKNRLLLENFSGETVAAVEQDFYATIFISGLESLFSQEASLKLEAKTASNKYPQRVNQAVSFNALKNKAIDILLTEIDPTFILDKLTAIFLLKPTCIRKNRSVPRPKQRSASRTAWHLKRRKKICY